MRFSKWVIIAIGVLLVSFIVAVLWLCWQDKSIPDALIYGVFGCITGELSVLGMIKRKEGAPNGQEEG
ncbi:MAG: hypothetical protein RR051_03185 [Clostridiales bacterium]